MIGLDELGEIAREAGARILSFYGGAVTTTLKADQSPVTAADLAAHDLILERLTRATPQIPIISEESALDEAAMQALLAQPGRVWLVDPLDGTRDFLARSGDFTVNIALIEGGRAVMGCIFAPVRGDLYVAAAGQGAHGFFGSARSERKLCATTMAEQNPRLLLSRQHQSDEAALLRKYLPNASIRHIGSSLKYAMIAAGEADVAIRKTPTMLWDTAAAQCLLEEAGGMLLDAKGESLAYSGPNLTNPAFMALGHGTSPEFRKTLSQVFVAPSFA